jgi:hypothetical protein
MTKGKSRVNLMSFGYFQDRLDALVTITGRHDETGIEISKVE